MNENEANKKNPLFTSAIIIISTLLFWFLLSTLFPTVSDNEGDSFATFIEFEKNNEKYSCNSLISTTKKIVPSEDAKKHGVIDFEMNIFEYMAKNNVEFKSCEEEIILASKKWCRSEAYLKLEAFDEFKADKVNDHDNLYQFGYYTSPGNKKFCEKELSIVDGYLKFKF